MKATLPNGTVIEGSSEELLEFIKGTLPKTKDSVASRKKRKEAIHFAPMINKRDWTTKGAKTSRFYKVSPSRARQIEQVTTPTIPDVTETFCRHFRNNRIIVGATFFHALADVMKEDDEKRTRSFLRQFMDDEQYLTVFLPFIVKYGKQFKERFNLGGNIKIMMGGIQLT